MGRYMGKCKGVVGEIAVVGVRTRARDVLAMGATPSSPGKKIKKAPAETTTPYDVHDELRSRRRLVMTEEENSAYSTSSRPEVTTSSSDVVLAVPAANCSSGEVVSSDFPAFSSSSTCNDASSSGEVVKDRLETVADPEVESALTSSKYLECQSATRAASSSITSMESAVSGIAISTSRREKKIRAPKSDDLDSPPRHPDTKPTVHVKIPSDSEIEEFFAAAEKDIQKRFTEKYNFDIVKGVPLEGRYEWVPIKP